MKLEGIHHIALNVADLDRAERFYVEVLGFKVLQRFSKGLRHLMLDTGNAAIALFEVPELATRKPLEQLSDEGYMHLAFQASPDLFEEIIQELKSKDVALTSGPVKRGDGESVYFNDPDFNHLEIHCDH
jgi:catechol 2,3-dioxygenase-like lactoylglutathione lyase family enzyme